MAEDRQKQLEAVIRAYNEAADKFITKVERGEARSRVTYAELKAAREMAEKAGVK